MIRRETVLTRSDNWVRPENSIFPDLGNEPECRRSESRPSGNLNSSPSASPASLGAQLNPVEAPHNSTLRQALKAASTKKQPPILAPDTTPMVHPENPRKPKQSQFCFMQGKYRCHNTMQPIKVSLAKHRELHDISFTLRQISFKLDFASCGNNILTFGTVVLI